MALSLRLEKGFDSSGGGFRLDVALEAGSDITVLFGPSGAGKSLVLNMISGIVRPEAGYVRVGGDTLFDSQSGVDVPMRLRRVGHLFQDYALFPHMTVFENVAYGVGGRDGEARRRRVGELLDLMRLAGLEGRYPRELSGGQRQRAALARTLAAGPRVLLLDEPFSALDSLVREKLRADLLDIHRLFPVSTLLVTHDLEEAFEMGERIAVINEGRIIQHGTREEVFFRPATRDVARFVGTRNIFDGVVRSATADGVVVECPPLGVLEAHCADRRPPGSRVTLCIRPEEIYIIRPDRPLDPRVARNVVEGRIRAVSGRGASTVLRLETDRRALLKIEVPNFVARKLGLAKETPLKVSLKKESLWVIGAPSGGR
ncbi:MAG TPA: ABC transporter ATP-binding protein [Deltaproteobacteria bacterium]|nr:ABC transporter ATP-binding protein [Deltaproteobacteria bacterium]